MIAFGCAINDESTYARYGASTIAGLMEPDSVVMERRGFDSIQEPYNGILDEAGALRELEALVLLHQDTVVEATDVLAKAREALLDPTVGMVGTFGVTSVSSADWWRGGEPRGSFALPLIGAQYTYASGSHAVDAIDGYFMILSPAVIRDFRFDPRFTRDFHCYDIDFCVQVRSRGLRIIVVDAPNAHHSLFVRDRIKWLRAGLELHRKWDPRLRPPIW